MIYLIEDTEYTDRETLREMFNLSRTKLHKLLIIYSGLVINYKGIYLYETDRVINFLKRCTKKKIKYKDTLYFHKAIFRKDIETWINSDFKHNTYLERAKWFFHTFIIDKDNEKSVMIWFNNYCNRKSISIDIDNYDKDYKYVEPNFHHKN